MSMIVAMLTFFAVISLGLLARGDSPHLRESLQRFVSALLTLVLAFVVLSLACALSAGWTNDYESVRLIWFIGSLFLLAGTALALFWCAIRPPEQDHDERPLELFSLDKPSQPVYVFPWHPKQFVYAIVWLISIVVACKLCFGGFTIPAVLYTSGALLILMVMSVFVTAAASSLKYSVPFPLTFTSLAILVELLMLAIALITLASNFPKLPI